MELSDEDIKFGLLKNKTVLNVDDSEFNQFVIKKILESLGMTTISAENGSVAIAKLKEGLRPDVILMDLQMPVMNGVETTRIIKKEVSSDIPIIINSGYVDGVERWKLRRLGVTDFLEKPYSREDILSKILLRISSPGHDAK